MFIISSNNSETITLLRQITLSLLQANPQDFSYFSPLPHSIGYLRLCIVPDKARLTLEILQCIMTDILVLEAQVLSRKGLISFSLSPSTGCVGFFAKCVLKVELSRVLMSLSV